MSAEDRQMEANGEETAGNSVHDSLGSSSHIRRDLQDAQSTAQRAAAVSAEPQQKEATGSEIRKSKRRKPLRSPQYTCTTCGMGCVNQRNLHLHMYSHIADNAFVCSLCGIRKSKYQTRNDHERDTHAMKRHKEDRHRKEAIRILPEQRSTFRQVGTNIETIQTAAVASGCPTGPPAVFWTKPPAKRTCRRPSARKPKRSRRSSSTPRTSADKSQEETSGSEEDGEDEEDEEDEPPTSAAHEEQQVVPELPPVQPTQAPAGCLNTYQWFAWMRAKEVNAENAEKELRGRIRTLEAKVVEKNRRLDAASKRNNSLKAAKDSLTTKCAKLAEDTVALKSQCDELLEARSRLNNEKNELESKNGELESTVARLESDSAKLRESAKQTEEAREAVVHENDRLQHENEKLKTQLGEQDGRAASLQASHNLQLREEQKKTEVWEKKAAAFENQIDGLRSENFALVSAADRSKATVAALDSECAALRKKASDAAEARETAVQELKRKNEDLQLKCEELGTTVAHREADCEALRKKASDAEEAAAAKLKRETDKLKAKWKEQEDRDERWIQKLGKQNREQQEEATKMAAEWAAKEAALQKRVDEEKAENVALVSTRSALIAECAKLLQASASAAANLHAFADRNGIRELTADRWRQVGSVDQAADCRPATEQR